MLSFDETPINRALRLEMVRRDETATEIAMPVEEWLTQENGVVHGGIIASLADTTAIHALAGSLNDSQFLTGVEFKINFLRSARLGGGNLVARASIVRRGKTISLCEVDVHQSGEIVAKGLFTYIVLPARKDS